MLLDLKAFKGNGKVVLAIIRSLNALSQ